MGTVSFKGIIAKLVAAAKSFKSDILRAADKAPTIVAEVAKDAPEVGAVVELAFPGAAAIEEAGVTLIELVAEAIEAAGPAAAANGLSISLDKVLVGKIQSLLPAVKQFAAKL